MFRIPLLRTVFCISFLLSFVAAGYSQAVEEPVINPVNAIVTYADKVYHLDDRLVNGTYYIPSHPLALGHPYFLTKEWQKAKLFIKGITYENVEIKYNIEDDQIIYKRQYERGLVEEILLKNTFIDSLDVDGRRFINSALMEVNKPLGFLERIYVGNYTAFLKHSRLYKDELSHTVQWGKYLDPKKTLYLFYGDELIRINDKNSLLDMFPEHEKLIKKFMRKQRIRFRKASKDQLANLLKYCDGL